MNKIKEKVTKFWNKNGKKITQVAIVGIGGALTIKATFFIGECFGSVGTMNYIQENVPEAYKMIMEYGRSIGEI